MSLMKKSIVINKYDKVLRLNKKHPLCKFLSRVELLFNQNYPNSTFLINTIDFKNILNRWFKMKRLLKKYPELIEVFL